MNRGVISEGFKYVQHFSEIKKSDNKGGDLFYYIMYVHISLVFRVHGMYIHTW